MALITTKGLANKFRGTMTNVTYDMDGQIFLTPENLFGDWGDLVEVRPGRHPKRGRHEIPRHPNGFHVYAGTSPNDLVRQNESPLPLDERYTFLLASIKTEGHPPSPTTDVLDTDYPAPPMPVLRDLPNTNAGFSAGSRSVAFSLVDAGGRHTFLTPGTTFSLTSAQSFTQPLPQIPVRGASGVGIWLTSPGSSIYYLQRVVDLASQQPDTFNLTGPFSTQRKAPTYNETFLGASPRPGVTAATALSTLRLGNYRFFATRVTTAGESLPSYALDYYLTKDYPHLVIRLSPPAIPTGVIGWYLYARQADGRTYVVHKAEDSPEKPLSTTQVAEVYSYDPGGWPATWAVSQRELPTEDKSGIPSIAIAPDAPTAFSTSLPGASYYLAFAHADEEQEGPIGPLNGVTVAANRAVLAVAQKTVQQVVNAEGGEVGADGLPLEHGIITTGGTATVAGGEHTLDTTGTVTTTTPSFGAPVVQIDQTQDYSATGEIEVTARTSGQAEVALLEYNITTPLLSTTTPIKTTVLQSVADVGTDEYDFDIPTGTGFWNAATVSARLVYRMNVAADSSTNKNLTAVFRHNGLFPHLHKPFKLDETDESTAAPDNAEVDSTKKHKNRHHKGIHRPRQKKRRPPGRQYTNVDRPLDISRTVLLSRPTGVASGTAETVDTGLRHRLGLTINTSVAVPASGFTSVLELRNTADALIAAVRVYSDATVRCAYLNASVIYEATILKGYTSNAILNLDLGTSGSGGTDAIVSVWASIGAGVARTQQGRYEGLDHTGIYAQRYYAAGTVTSVTARDGGQNYHRDHNWAGKIINHARTFIVAGSGKRQDAHLQKIRQAVKPGQRYAIGAYLRWKGLKSTHHPVYITLHKLNGDQIQIGSVVGDAGASGTVGWQDYVREVQVPAYDATNLNNNVYEMRINSKDFSQGVVVGQEFACTELTSTDPLAVKRTGLSATSGVYRVTIDTGSPLREGYYGAIPRKWLRLGLALAAEPVGTAVAVRLRSSSDLLSYTPYFTLLSSVPQHRYLEIELTFTGDGTASSVLEALSPFIQQQLATATLLREDGSEFPGGVIVTDFPFPALTPEVDVQIAASGRAHRQRIAADVDRLGGFGIQVFSELALEEIRKTALTGYFRVEGFGQALRIKMLKPPDIKPVPAHMRVSRVSLDGQWYHIYAKGTAGESEVLERAEIVDA